MDFGSLPVSVALHGASTCLRTNSRSPGVLANVGRSKIEAFSRRRIRAWTERAADRRRFWRQRSSPGASSASNQCPRITVLGSRRTPTSSASHQTRDLLRLPSVSANDTG